MSDIINRRDWFRKSVLLTGGAALAPAFWQSLKAAPAAGFTPSAITELPDASLPMKARLIFNENPFGPSDKAKQTMMDSLSTSYQYAFTENDALKKMIADYEGITPDHILLGAGSSPLLTAAAIHFTKNGGSVVTCDPTFDSLPKSAEQLDGKWIKVPLTADYKFDLDGISQRLDNNASLVYIVNPNNPTATIVDADKLKAFCTSTSKKIPVFVDEAYIDYLPDPQGTTTIANIKNGDNIIVARTFSKIYGLAGMRIGYIVAQPDMIKTLAKYNVDVLGTLSIKAAIASYQDKDFMKTSLEKTLASKDYLYDVLKKSGYEYIPSSANFVMFSIKMEGKQFTDEMLKRGAGVRFWKFNNKEWCRVSVGRMDEMEVFASALKEVKAV